MSITRADFADPALAAFLAAPDRPGRRAQRPQHPQLVGAQGPAALLGLDAGVLAEGAAADVILFDAGAPIIIDADALHSKSKNSPFDGRRLQGKLIGTWVGGRKVF